MTLYVLWTQMTFQKAGSETSLETEIPFRLVEELFNVNHFIVSQASPYIAPWLHLKESTQERSPLAAKVRANPWTLHKAEFAMPHSLLG
jgi:hypothetical protein